MSPAVLVVCPNPSCTGRSVQDGEVIRELWEATWHEAILYEPGQGGQPAEWASDITCPQCGEEGIDPESGQLDSAEEELGRRCEFCGVVSEPKRWMYRHTSQLRCPHCQAVP